MAIGDIRSWIRARMPAISYERAAARRAAVRRAVVRRLPVTPSPVRAAERRAEVRRRVVRAVRPAVREVREKVVRPAAERVRELREARDVREAALVQMRVAQMPEYTPAEARKQAIDFKLAAERRQALLEKGIPGAPKQVLAGIAEMGTGFREVMESRIKAETARQQAKFQEGTISERTMRFQERAAQVAKVAREFEEPVMERVARVEERIGVRIPTPVKEVAVGVAITGPAAAVEMAGMVPVGVEAMWKRREIIPAAAVVGAYEMGRGIYTGFVTAPYRTAGEFIAFGAIARGVGVAARPVTPKIRVYKAPDIRKTVVEVGKYRPIEITKAVKEVRTKKVAGEDVMLERVSSYEARLGQLRYTHDIAAIGRLRGGYLLERVKPPKPPSRVELPPTERGLVPLREPRLMIEAPKPKPTRIYAEIAKPYVKIADIPLYGTKARLAWVEMGMRRLTYGVRGEIGQPAWTRTFTGPGRRVPPPFIPREPLPEPPSTFEVSTIMRQRLAAGEKGISREMRVIEENIIRERIRAEELPPHVPRKPPIKIPRPPTEPTPVARPPPTYELPIPPKLPPRAPEPSLAPEMPRPARPRVTVAERPPAVEMPFLEPAPARPIPEVRPVLDVVKTIISETKKARTEQVKAHQRAEQDISRARRRGAEHRATTEKKTRLKFVPFIARAKITEPHRVPVPYRAPTDEEKRRPVPYWIPEPIPEPIPAPAPVPYPTPTPVPDVVPVPEPVPAPAPVPYPVPTPYKVPPPPPIDYKRPPPPPPIKIPRPDEDEKKRALRKRRKAEKKWWLVENPIAALDEIMIGRRMEGLPKKRKR